MRTLSFQTLNIRKNETSFTYRIAAAVRVASMMKSFSTIGGIFSRCKKSWAGMEFGWGGGGGG